MQTTEKELNTPTETILKTENNSIKKEKETIKNENSEFNPNINLSPMFNDLEKEANDEYLKLMKEKKDLLRIDSYFCYYTTITLMENKQAALQDLKFHIARQERLWQNMYDHQIQNEKKKT